MLAAIIVNLKQKKNIKFVKLASLLIFPDSFLALFRQTKPGNRRFSSGVKLLHHSFQRQNFAKPVIFKVKEYLFLPNLIELDNNFFR